MGKSKRFMVEKERKPRTKYNEAQTIERDSNPQETLYIKAKFEKEHENKFEEFAQALFNTNKIESKEKKSEDDKVYVLFQKGEYKIIEPFNHCINNDEQHNKINKQTKSNISSEFYIKNKNILSTNKLHMILTKCDNIIRKYKEVIATSYVFLSCLVCMLSILLINVYVSLNFTFFEGLIFVKNLISMYFIHSWMKFVDKTIERYAGFVFFIWLFAYINISGCLYILARMVSAYLRSKESYFFS